MVVLVWSSIDHYFCRPSFCKVNPLKRQLPPPHPGSYGIGQSLLPYRHAIVGRLIQVIDPPIKNQR
ncbi:hypothetical protein SAMN04490199_5125 [Pseudomonas marginalis]|nr:hypothetical protein SAMN04490199_5125 [Pseudomonas marginalis]